MVPAASVSETTSAPEAALNCAEAFPPSAGPAMDPVNSPEVIEIVTPSAIVTVPAVTMVSGALVTLTSNSTISTSRVLLFSAVNVTSPALTCPLMTISPWVTFSAAYATLVT